MAVRASPRRNHRRLSHRPRRRRNGAARRRGPLRRLLRRTWFLWIPLLLAGLTGSGALAYLYVTIELPEPDVQAQTTFLFDREGHLLAGLHGAEDRIEIPLERVPRHLRNAVLAAEDERFYSHPGVSPLAILRAAWADVTNRSIEQGASTITQQLVRNAFSTVGTERTFSRKAREAVLALKLEREMSKDEILESYLNTVYFGAGAYGVEAAAETYFDRPARDLTLLQSATLAGIISRPQDFSPTTDPGAAKIRRDWVLGRMADLGYISEERARVLRERPLRVVSHDEGFEGSPAAWFIDFTRRYLVENFGAQATFAGGLRVRTTVDVDWQRAANRALHEWLSYPGAPDGALVAIDPTNGAIRAIASSSRYSADPEKRLFDPATFGCPSTGCNPADPAGGTGRQTGSAAKVFTLATAVHQGISLRSTFSGRSPTVIDDPTCFTGGEPWDPENYGGAQFGTLDLVSATASSVNTIFAQLIAEVGPENVVEMAHRLGIKSALAPVCALTLGAMEVNVLEMTNAFATLASGGVRHEPTPVAAVRGPDGEVLWRNRGRGERVLPENDAWQVVYALQRVVTGGTGTRAYFGVPAFGKTGTEDDNSDAWFCGGTTALVACVWVGHHRAQVPAYTSYGSGVTGGTLPAPIWHDFMVAAHEDLEAEPFPVPELTGEILEGSPAPSPSPTEKEKKEKVKEEEQPAPPSPTKPPPAPPSPTKPPPTSPPPTTPPPSPPPPPTTPPPPAPPP